MNESIAAKKRPEVKHGCGDSSRRLPPAHSRTQGLNDAKMARGCHSVSSVCSVGRLFFDSLVCAKKPTLHPEPRRLQVSELAESRGLLKRARFR
jgi:hypothetical protein